MATKEVNESELDYKIKHILLIKNPTMEIVSIKDIKEFKIKYLLENIEADYAYELSQPIQVPINENE